ncbi:MAG: FkbM family methyltransferase [Thermoprotei archaeon]
MENKLDAFLSWYLGMGRELRFKSGFTITSGEKYRITSMLLATFAHYGARLVGCDSSDYFGWRVCLDGSFITTPSGIRFTLDSLDPLIFAETFIHEIHFVGFDLRGRIVLDVGGYVGDTALYFAQKGAKVYVYEPDPINYAKLQRNLELNPELSRLIVARNEAVGLDGEATFMYGQWGNSSFTNKHGKPVKVKSVSLKTIFRENDLSEAYLLKADCKGCEFVLADQEELKAFKVLTIEYTNTTKQCTELWGLIEKLRIMGFNRTRVYKHTLGFSEICEHGVIHAQRD